MGPETGDRSRSDGVRNAECLHDVPQSTIRHPQSDSTPSAPHPAPVRILRIITRLNIGGPSVHAVLLAGGLDPDRFSTCLVSGRPDAEEGAMDHAAVQAGVRLRRLPSLRRALHPWRDLAAFLGLLQVLWQERPHILHTHMAKAGTLGRVAGWCYNAWGPGRAPGEQAMLVHTFHGHVLDGYFPLWLSRLFVTIERGLARRTTRLIAVSPAVRRELLEKGIGTPAQWRTILLGLDLARLGALGPPAADGPLRVGMVGRLVPIKNPGLFLQALAKVRARRPELDLAGWVVGDGPLRAALEEEAARLGLKGTVRFTGWQHDLSAVYEPLEVACLTSWNEGTPVSLIEAMAAARAVVATDVGGVRDLLQGGEASGLPVAPGTFLLAARGILIRPGDAEGLSAALARLARDAALRRTLGEAARGHVLQAFSRERLIREMTALYEELEQERRACTC